MAMLVSIYSVLFFASNSELLPTDVTERRISSVQSSGLRTVAALALQCTHATCHPSTNGGAIHITIPPFLITGPSKIFLN
eukprot:1065559-Amphidinium_carterae.1